MAGPSAGSVPRPISSFMCEIPFVNTAFWIWSAEGSHAAPAPEQASPSHYQVRYFRRSFDVADPAAAALTIHVSGDSRYLFYCNGRLIGRGPAKGDVHHQFYETFDLTPHLRAGRNVLAALVFDMSRVVPRPEFLGPPCSVMTYTGGFVMDGILREGVTETSLHTNAIWKVAVDRGYRFQNEGLTLDGYLGYFEHRVSRLILPGWTVPDFDDTGWSPALAMYKAERREDRRDPASPYGLVPRLIPMLEEGRPEDFTDIFLTGGAVASAAWHELRTNGRPLTLPAHATVSLVLDAGRLTTAYPCLHASGGAGSNVRLTYAEALRLPWDTPGAVLLGRQQPLANLAVNFSDVGRGWTFDRRGQVVGWSDIWEPSGREDAFVPLHWRAFRYIGLKIEVGAEPLNLLGLKHRFCAYPYRVAAEFRASDPMLEKIWHVGLHTMRLCSHETFEDCPYYEQMQYAGDTMITSKIAMLTTGDYQLSRQSLYQLDWSRFSDGLTQSRYPSRLVQVIPSSSLHWVTHVKDYFLYTGDHTTVRELLPGVRSVVDWYGRQADADGLPAKLPFWNFTDWCPWWPRGVMPGADSGPTCIHAAQYINALDELAFLVRHLRSADDAEPLRRQADDLRRRAHHRFWSEKEGLYFDRPGGPELSQYANAWAIVAGMAGPQERATMLRRFPNDSQLAPGSFFWWHAGFAALARCGKVDDMTRHLDPWRESVDHGLSTFVEDNSYWRSLCHAWSAHPVLAFQQWILGVTPVEPGFAQVQIAPRCCGIAWASGSVCTPRGLIQVAWRAQADAFVIEVELPVGVTGTVIAPEGERRPLKEGKFIGRFVPVRVG